MKKYKIQTIAIILILTIGACRNQSGTNTVLPPPDAFQLIFPLKNSECNVGTDSTDTESTVLFEWNKSENADFYQLNIRNLSSDEKVTDTTAEQSIPIVLKRAVPYEWYVVAISKIQQDSTQSEIWRFYNAGLPEEAHIPFPAEIISPKMSEQISTAASSISLSWRGSDIDNDITGYEVYFGIDKEPPVFKSNTADTVLSNVSISANTIYYWEIVTFDAKGNSSESGVYQFKVK